MENDRLQKILERFNKDVNDEFLTEEERVILLKIQEVEKQIIEQQKIQKEAQDKILVLSGKHTALFDVLKDI